MAQRPRIWWRRLLALTLLLGLVTALPGVRAQGRQPAAPQITLIVTDPGDPSLQYGVDAVQQVLQSTDGGDTWTAIFSPGDAQAPDPSTPGACLPGNYERVTFLALNPAHPHGLYVGTDGVLGDYMDNGCGNASGGLFYRATVTDSFLPLNHGLPASFDSRGGGTAWGVRAIAFDPRHPATVYVVTDPSFLVGPGIERPANPVAPGIYRSTDNGLQWDAAFSGIATTRCQYALCRDPGSLAVDPAQPDILLYATDTGFYRSVDAGQQWRLQERLAWSDGSQFITRFDPYRDTLAYVVTDRAIYRTDDSGRHLAQVVRAGLPAPATIVDISFLETTPPGVVLVLHDGRRLAIADSGSSAPAAATPTLVPTALPAATTSVPTAVPASARSSPTASHPKSKRRVVPTTPITRKVAAGLVASWPMAGHDPAQSFADPATTLTAASASHLRLRWQHAGITPAIEAAGKLYAIDAGTGQVISLAAGSGIVAHRFLSTDVQSLAYAGRLLYFNRGSEIRIVDAGTAGWQHTATGRQGDGSTVFGSPVVSGNILFTGEGVQNAGGAPQDYAFDARTGRLIWTHAADIGSVPCLAGDTLYLSSGPFGAGDSYLLDPATAAVRRILKGYGSVQWHASGGRIYAGILNGSNGRLEARIEAWDRQGRRRWTAHDLLFGAALPDRLIGVAPGLVDVRSAVDGHRLWKMTVPGLQPGSSGPGVLMLGNIVIAQAGDGQISVLDARTGHLLRTLRPPMAGAYAANLIAGDGLIFESVNRRRGDGKVGQPILLAFGR